METLPYDINDNGDVVGLFYSPGSIEENSAFVMRNGQITTFKYPAAQYTEAHHIDNNGDIYGLFRTTPADPTYFLLHNNTYTEIDAAIYNAVANVSQDFSSAEFSGADSTTVVGADASGDIVGGYTEEFVTKHRKIAPNLTITYADRCIVARICIVNCVTGVNDDLISTIGRKAFRRNWDNKRCWNPRSRCNRSNRPLSRGRHPSRSQDGLRLENILRVPVEKPSSG